MFHYCAYWKTWSKVIFKSDIHDQNIGGTTVEVNLTPIPGTDTTWENYVEPVIIRVHSTPFESGDKYLNRLPEDVYQTMVNNLGEGYVNYLLNEDFLSQIDWELYKRFDNGGAKLDKIKKFRN